MRSLSASVILGIKKPEEVERNSKSASADGVKVAEPIPTFCANEVVENATIKKGRIKFFIAI